MPPSSSSWVNPDDLLESSFWISGQNTFTGVPITSGGPVEIGEVSESGMSLTVPANSCAVGHLLTLQIHRTGKSEPEILLTAKVTESEAIETTGPGEKLKAITLKFYQLDENAWRKFLAEFNERQRRTQNQVNAVRGD
jgi:hypothetical protein